MNSMRVKCKPTMDGPGPSEKIVTIVTSSGHAEEVIVDSSIVAGNTVEVGRIGEREDSVLIELPKESAAGNWRLWVPSTSVE
jgi:hypothetical protein